MAGKDVFRLISLALIFICGMLLGQLVKKIGMPPLIGMLLAGIILGPGVLKLLHPNLLMLSPDIRQFALIVILTRAGLSLNIDDIRKVGRPAVLMSFIPGIFEMIATTLIAPLILNITYLEAAIMAAIIASASPAVVVPRMLNYLESGYGTNKRIPQLVLAGDSLSNVFHIVVFSALMTLYTQQEISFLHVAEVPLAIGAGILAGVLIGFGLESIFKLLKMRGSHKLLLLLAVAFILVSLEDRISEVLAFSGILSVMTAGIYLYKRSPKDAAYLSEKLEGIWVPTEIILFALIGAEVNLESASFAGAGAILLISAALLLRGVGVFLCLIKTDLNFKERLFCTLTDIPKATVQAALGGIPLTMGVENGEIILAVSVISILFTAPLGAIAIDLGQKRLLTPEKQDSSGAASITDIK